MAEKFKKALQLEYFTIAYNLLEALVSVIAGKAAGSIALIGFGLDSIVESLSGMVLVWRLKKHGSVSEEEEEALEQKASRFPRWGGRGAQRSPGRRRPGTWKRTRPRKNRSSPR